MDGKCAEFRDASWQYKLCLNRKIEQLNARQMNDRYLLAEGQGSRNPSSDTSRVYTDGDDCPAINGPRSATVSFFCGSKTSSGTLVTGESFAILSVREKQTCHYAFTVVSPIFCGNKAFVEAPIVAGDDMSNILLTGADDAHEAWMLEAGKYAGPNGLMFCTAMSAEDALSGMGRTMKPLTFFFSARNTHYPTSGSKC